MRLFQLDPLGVLAILAMLLVLSVPFEKPATTASRAAQTLPLMNVQAHDSAANTSAPAKAQREVSQAGALH